MAVLADLRRDIGAAEGIKAFLMNVEQQLD
jgi:hypothetical protein